MHKILKIVMVIVGLVVAWYVPDLYAEEVARFKIEYAKAEYDVPVRCARDLPDPYDPTGKIDPFASMETWYVQTAAVVKEPVEVVQVPDTVLTRLAIQQYDLTSIIIGESFRWAFFTSEAGKGRSYKGSEGDYIGKDGVKIESIDLGIVQLTDGSAITKKVW